VSVRIEGLTATTRSGIARELSAYPSLEGGRAEAIPLNEHDERVVTEFVPGRPVCPVVTWHFTQARDPCEVLDELGRTLPFHEDGLRIAMPRVNQSDYLSPLVLWWSTLFGLSTFARYESELWLSALDVDKSELAVPLEELLDVAMSSVPALVLEELLEGHMRPQNTTELEGG
jgi:hypothetical protein